MGKNRSGQDTPGQATGLPEDETLWVAPQAAIDEARRRLARRRPKRIIVRNGDWSAE